MLKITDMRMQKSGAVAGLTGIRIHEYIRKGASTLEQVPFMRHQSGDMDADLRAGAEMLDIFQLVPDDIRTLVNRQREKNTDQFSLRRSTYILPEALNRQRIRIPAFLRYRPCVWLLHCGVERSDHQS